MFQRLFRLTPYAKRHRVQLAGIIVMTLMASGTMLLQPWPLKILVDYALGDVAAPAAIEGGLDWLGIGSSPWSLVLLAALLTLVIFVVNSALDIGLRWAWMATGQRMVYELACDTFDRLLHLSLPFHARHSVGDQLTRLTGDTWCVFKVISEILVSPVQRIVSIFGIALVSWYLDPLLTCVAFGVAPVVATSVWYFGPRLKRRARQGRRIQARMNSFVHQTVTSIPLVQAYNAASRNQTRYGELADDAVAVAQRGVLLNKSFGLVNGVANSASRATIIFVGGLQVLGGDLSVGSLLVFLTYVRNLQTACTQLLQSYAQLKTTEASLDRILEILDSDEIVHSDPLASPLSMPPAQRGLEVELREVTFGYLRDRPILSNVSLRIEPGQHVALVGPSGAGKTTLAALLTRLHDVWSGGVYVNGQDVRQLELESLRNHVSLLLQDPYLLPISVAENIAIGRPDASREQIVAAARAGGADEFIRGLPEGYDTLIGQRGMTLSGGQQQRLAIARAFVRDAPLLILDEPTSALDSKTERTMVEALRRLMANRTTITIAHRLSSVRDVDRIFVLQQGQILESGTHEELIRNGKLYDRFHSIHSRVKLHGVRA